MSQLATRGPAASGTLAGRVRRALVLLFGIALLGELGHQLLGRWGQALAHHLFHVLFAGTAVLVFGAYAVVDIRRHGWPRFSRRLRP